MSDATWYLLAADAILVVHFAFVLFVVFGLVLIIVGHFLHWTWIRRLWFRVFHLIAIGFVILQAWLGEICPLTVWEMELRARAGEAVYAGSFIAHWLQAALYYSAPMWVFTVAYTVFGALVLATWYLIPPVRSTRVD